MKELKIEEILEEIDGELIIGNKELVCETFSKDTRKIEKGDIYIGIKGENFDGNKFWKEALRKGAKAAIVENVKFEPEELKEFEDKTIIKVKNTLETLYAMAKIKRNKYNIPVIAITGSVGKTSTKDIIANVVSQKYKTLKTIGNNNNNIGLPFTILRLKDEEAMVLEMGMNHFGEISLLSKIAKPQICVITNIGTSHIGNLGSRENILKAKLEILEGAENPTIIINNDNDLLHSWYEKNKEKLNIKTYGIKNKSELNAKNIILKEESSTFRCDLQNETKITVPVGGEHFVLNSLCAVAVGKTLDISEKEIVKGIESFELTKKRMDITELESGIKIINDAYNASFESMSATLEYLSKTTNSRKIAVLGDMFELGEYSEELHEKVGEEVLKDNMDILICMGEMAKRIYEAAIKSGMKKENAYYIKNQEEIIQLLKQICKKEDIILFKASNGMKFYEIAEKAKEEL